MGRTACTEPQCLYKGDLYLYLQLLCRLPNISELIFCLTEDIMSPITNHIVSTVRGGGSQYMLQSFGKPEGGQGHQELHYSAYVLVFLCSIKCNLAVISLDGTYGQRSSCV